jgi:hypothetical protein
MLHSLLPDAWMKKSPKLYVVQYIVSGDNDT